MISICLNTKNRPGKLRACLKSILASKYQNWETIIVDQSNKTEIISANKLLTGLSPKIRYFQNFEKGVSRAKNFALAKARAEIIAFTDDDCLVDKNWLRIIYQSFQKNKDIIGVFGKVLPYQPQLNNGKICPCIFTSNKKRIIDKPDLHWQNIGFGNNMAFRKEIFAKVGGFKEWLGPGSIGSNAEDAEFALRCLVEGYKLMYNPQMIIYHNRWLTQEEYRRQCLSYSCGEMACYGYFAFQGHKFAKKVVVDNFKDSYWEFRKAVKSLLLFKKGSVKLLFENFEKFIFRLRGLLVGWYYSRKNPLRI
jgi:glycosyltransferase involved in cell wall biosynthesis